MGAVLFHTIRSNIFKLKFIVLTPKSDRFVRAAVTNCEPNPCQANAICIDDPNTARGYSCQCRKGYRSVLLRFILLEVSPAFDGTVVGVLSSTLPLQAIASLLSMKIDSFTVFS